LTAKIPKSVGGRPEKNSSWRDEEFLDKKPKTQIIKEMGFNRDQVSQFETLAKSKDIMESKEALSHGST
jgi:fructose-1,6-bisphosphatase/sedoheptulose 1,7-bisphosphatase-like protein